jgi:hypothetical protein
MKREWQECLVPDRDAVKLCISLNARGEIAMNDATWNELGRPWFVVVLFEPASRLIGIRFAKPETRNALPVRLYGASKARVVRARRLLRQFDIEITETLRFASPRLAAGIWELDLQTAFTPGKSKNHWRKKAGRGMQYAECGMRSAECGVRNAECGVQNEKPLTAHRSPLTTDR